MSTTTLSGLDDPYVEEMLKDYLGVSELVTDDEGDYPVRAGSAKYYVRLDNEAEPTSVRVYAHILVGVTANAKLYETLNAVNSHITFGRMFHQGDAVLVACRLRMRYNGDRYGMARTAHWVFCVDEDRGCVVSFRSFRDRSEALEAAGLPS